MLTLVPFESKVTSPLTHACIDVTVLAVPWTRLGTVGTIKSGRTAFVYQNYLLAESHLNKNLKNVRCRLQSLS